jgi:hypothetical protein
MTHTGNLAAPAEAGHREAGHRGARVGRRRRARAAHLLSPDVRHGIAQVRRRVRDAVRRGATEITILGVAAIDQALCAEGFIVTRVASEDGPYVVVAW